MRSLAVHYLGVVPYPEAHALQERLVEARKAGAIGDVLLMLEHPPVVTLGRAAKEKHLLLPREELERRGYDVHEIGRGGDVTLHGPGQLVGYPIVDLKPDRQDVRKYVYDLEETMIQVAAHYRLTGGRIQGLNGAWIGDRKVGAVGVRISRWVTMHGFALNVNTDLGLFDVIVPCGIQDREVTSIAREIGREVDFAEARGLAASIFAERLGAQFEVFEGAPEVG